ncbi:Transposase [Bacteroidales bacterium Barb6]|nr:Transposase [Bacteroidales bacterium Barb6XT]OAV68988.1 Transposase [Bacteroidales bacterium Barb6]
MNCPKCNSEKKIKAGSVKGRQRYKCKECGCNYTVELKSTAKPDSVKKQAFQLYLEGASFRSIGKLLGVSNVSVFNWVKKLSKEAQETNINEI